MIRLILSIFASLILINAAYAEETVETEIPDHLQEEYHFIYIFPEIKPKYSFIGGYRIIDTEGSKRAAEYEYPHDSVVLIGNVRALPFPHRIHFEFDFFNEKDLFADLSYAYKDLILSRWINKTLFHNLENIRLFDLGPHIRYSIEQNDSSESYGVKSATNMFFVRFKTPDFPFHVYIDGQVIDKDGLKQQRFLGGSGYFNDLQRISRKRDIDWQTRDIKFGFNTHTGPVEIDVSHSEKRFSSGGDSVFHSFYNSGIREPGTYPHNRIPDFKGSTDTIKLHTSYTGKIVASATLSRYSRENEYSGAQADYFIGSTDITYMPLPKLTFFFKFRHRESDIDNPDSVRISDLTNPENSYIYSVRDSVSVKTDNLSGVVRYRAFKWLTVNAEVSHIYKDRKNANSWGLPKTTVKDTASISVKAKIFKSVNIKSRYIHEEIDETSYNISLDSRDKGIISISWNPLPAIFTYASYNVSTGRRDHVRYSIDESTVVLDGGKITDNKVFGMIGVNVSERVSIQTGYSYMNNKSTQPLIYGSDSEPQFIIDDNVLYKEEMYTFSTTLNCRLKKNLDIEGGIVVTEGSSNFDASAHDAVEPVSISDFSELKVRQTEYLLSGLYSFKDELDIGLNYSYREYENLIDRAINPVRDGSAHIILLSITKRWR